MIGNTTLKRKASGPSEKHDNDRTRQKLVTPPEKPVLKRKASDSLVVSPKRPKIEGQQRAKAPETNKAVNAGKGVAVRKPSEQVKKPAPQPPKSFLGSLLEEAATGKRATPPVPQVSISHTVQ
jgi:hypothetical protein